MGKASRDKGSRGERALVQFLKTKGWQAYRVPLSGAMAHFKCDVIAKTPDDRHVTFELKCRKNEYKTIYNMFTRLKSHNQFSVCENGEGFAMSGDVENTSLYTLHAEDVKTKNLSPQDLKTIRKLNKMRKLLGEAMLLVIKGDYQDFIFIRYF